MTHTTYTHTTTEHATIIARTALRTCAAKAGRAEKIDNMRAALAGRDAAAMRMYDTDAYDALRVQPLTDAADLVQVAALAIIECAAPCIADAAYILPDAVRKAAYKAVHKAIYAAAVRPALRDTYIEDMAHTDDGMEVSDPEYIKVTRYYDVHDWADYAVTMDMLQQIRPLLTHAERAVLSYRMQGLSGDAIAERLGVSKQRISNIRRNIQRIATRIWPDETRAFKL